MIGVDVMHRPLQGHSFGVIAPGKGVTVTARRHVIVVACAASRVGVLVLHVREGNRVEGAAIELVFGGPQQHEVGLFPIQPPGLFGLGDLHLTLEVVASRALGRAGIGLAFHMASEASPVGRLRQRGGVDIDIHQR